MAVTVADMPRNPRGIGPSPGPTAALTQRETQALALVCAGNSTRETAAAMAISPRTAGHHIENVRDKLGIHGSRVWLIRYAIANGLV